MTLTRTRSPVPAARDARELRGMAMALVATIAWSFAGLFTRLLTLDVCTGVAWRSFAGGALLFAIWLARHRSQALARLTSLTRADWLAVAVSTVAQSAFSACLFLTSVAHVAVIYAFTPFIAAFIAWVWLGERVDPATVVATLLSAGGVVVVVSGSLGSGSLAGDLLALLMTAAFATALVLPKVYPRLRIVESMFISAFITFAMFLPFSHFAAFDLRNAVLVSTYGAINLVLAYFLFVEGARYIPAATAGLIATLEIVLSPLWVWLVLGEKIDAPTALGGAIVFLAVAGRLALSAWVRPPAAQETLCRS